MVEGARALRVRCQHAARPLLAGNGDRDRARDVVLPHEGAADVLGSAHVVFDEHRGVAAQRLRSGAQSVEIDHDAPALGGPAVRCPQEEGQTVVLELQKARILDLETGGAWWRTLVLQRAG